MTHANVHTVEYIRRALVGEHCTLNDRDATITNGAGFAFVRTLDGTLTSQWSWVTAWNIVERGGAFYI